MLTIAPSGTNVIVRWLTSGCYNYTLQRADDLVTGSWTDMPGASSPYTNSVTATARFYRLKR